jgi:CO/xanthine dehydrogenase FAD-binding subunit
MMRLPPFTYRAARTIAEAAEFLAAADGSAMLVAGGTDVLPNMKRRQQTPSVLVGLRGVSELKEVTAADGLTIGAGVTLSDVLEIPSLRERYTGLWQAVSQIATPLLRNMGTLGGNLCLDTRCNYYDQTYEWRKAIDFCMKKDGETCWVAPSSRRCLAVSSTDAAPMLAALGAVVRLRSAERERRIAVADLYRNDGWITLASGTNCSPPWSFPLPTDGAAPTGSCGGAGRSISRSCPPPSPFRSPLTGRCRPPAWCSARSNRPRSRPATRVRRSSAPPSPTRQLPPPPSSPHTLPGRWTTPTSRWSGGNEWCARW